MVFNPLYYQMIQIQIQNITGNKEDDIEKKKKSRTKYTKIKQKKKSAEKPTQQYQRSEQNPAYAYMYFEALSQNTTGLAQICIQQKPLLYNQPTNYSSKPPPSSHYTNNRPAYQVQNSSPLFPNNFFQSNNQLAYQNTKLTSYIPK